MNKTEIKKKKKKKEKKAKGDTSERVNVCVCVCMRACVCALQAHRTAMQIYALDLTEKSSVQFGLSCTIDLRGQNNSLVIPLLFFQIKNVIRCSETLKLVDPLCRGNDNTESF